MKRWREFLIKPLFGALLFLLYFVVYWRRLILHASLPFDGGTFRVVIPTWEIGKNLLGNGHLLWDPFRNMGMPFLASPPNQALYPFRILSLFLNYLHYQQLYILFHSALASVFAYLLIRRKNSTFAAALAALAMAFNGTLLSKVTTSIDFAGFAWIPVILYFLEERRPWLLAFCLAAQWMAGLPTLCLFTVFLMALIAVSGPEPRHSFLVIGKAGVAAAGLSAVQVLPFLEMLGESTRPLFLSADAAQRFSLSPMELARPLFIPSFYLNTLKPLSDSDPAVIGFYVGPLMVGLAVLSFQTGGRRIRFWAAAAMIGLGLALGGYLPFYKYIPGITLFRFPALWLIPATVLIVLMAAEGLDRIQNPKIRFAVLVCCAMDFLIYAWPAKTPWGDLTFLTKAPEQLYTARPPAGTRLFHTERLLGSVRTWPLNTKEQWLLFLSAAVPSMSAADGMKEAKSLHQLPGRRAVKYGERLEEAPLDSPLFDRAGVSRIVTLNQSVAPGVVPESKNIVVIENSNPKPEWFTLEGLSADVNQMKPGSAELTVAGPSTLIGSETYYPGWTATIDGNIAPVQIYDEIFLSLAVPAGTHNVRWKYQPLPVTIGAWISGMTLAGLLAYGWAWRRRKLI